MVKNSTKTLSEKVTLSKNDYLKLLEAYQKIGQILIFQEKKKAVSTFKPALKSLHGIWKGVKIDEKDFQRAKQSLFKFSL